MKSYTKRAGLFPGTPAMKKFIMFFYLTGVAGIILPLTRNWFINLIPAVLLLSAASLVLFHSGGRFYRLVLASLIVYILSYAIEVAGVNTGLIFGQYRYGAGLGFRAFGTPLIIGLNWLMLVYMTSSVTEKYKMQGFPAVISASLIMLVYDIILEQVAPVVDMWYWAGGVVPLQNYLAWFLLAIGFHSIFKVFNVKTRNPLAEVILFSQFVFFMALSVYFHLLR
jgi:bisanhydrobacterioruberin hydratase